MHLPVIKKKKRAYHTDHNLKHSLHTVTMRWKEIQYHGVLLGGWDWQERGWIGGWRALSRLRRGLQRTNRLGITGGQTVNVRRKCYKNCIAWKCALWGNSFNTYKVIKKYKRINKKNSIQRRTLHSKNIPRLKLMS